MRRVQCCRFDRFVSFTNGVLFYNDNFIIYFVKKIHFFIFAKISFVLIVLGSYGVGKTTCICNFVDYYNCPAAAQHVKPSELGGKVEAEAEVSPNRYSVKEYNIYRLLLCGEKGEL